MVPDISFVHFKTFVHVTVIRHRTTFATQYTTGFEAVSFSVSSRCATTRLHHVALRGQVSARLRISPDGVKVGLRNSREGSYTFGSQMPLRTKAPAIQQRTKSQRKPLWGKLSQTSRQFSLERVRVGVNGTNIFATGGLTPRCIASDNFVTCTFRSMGLFKQAVAVAVIDTKQGTHCAVNQVPVFLMSRYGFSNCSVHCRSLTYRLSWFCRRKIIKYRREPPTSPVPEGIEISVRQNPEYQRFSRDVPRQRISTTSSRRRKGMRLR